MKEIHVHVFRVLEMDELSDDAAKKIVGLDNTNIRNEQNTKMGEMKEDTNIFCTTFIDYSQTITQIYEMNRIQKWEK